jgi:hypothetical protein
MIRKTDANDNATAAASARASLIETVTAIVLSVAGLMASWASHQGAMWNGMQSVHFGRANFERGAASRARFEGDMVRAVQIDLFSDWIEAKSRGNEALAQFYRTRMPANFRASSKPGWPPVRWSDPKAPPTPFAMPSYQPPGFAEADRAEKEAETQFALGEEASRTSYAYNRAGVVLATAMFFGGIGQVFRQTSVRFTLAAVSIVTWLIGLQLILAIPAVSLGQFSLDPRRAGATPRPRAGPAPARAQPQADAGLGAAFRSSLGLGRRGGTGADCGVRDRSRGGRALLLGRRLPSAEAGSGTVM